MLPPLTPTRLNLSPTATVQSSRSGFPRGMTEATWSLPYTLPQDFTLFLLLGQTSADTWIQKLDWIATHGGMALLNMHPDYLCFNGEKSSQRKFAAEFYEHFLKYVRRRYGESLWNPLPKELAAYITRMQASPARSQVICQMNGNRYRFEMDDN
jgi:hypothetical protein